ncbi:actin-related protein 2/3 complex subunit 3 [Lingula anatina]|uniref:Actin-related protein 2/3 complex subunit 3 n=1 Tax=Lingula anatina TaxID=7574 RepID=A0A1S3JPP5_LINAN|nr:actin-related protein 2/3 complex subunit 3 [Lingula anatina]|eukprot:XP_013412106.1 actin-related protein 2/3 complex subunit 3 [Lingula anatina]
MPAYHSQFTSPPQILGNMALLPLRTQFKGPAPKDSSDFDIIDEALHFFKANIFFKNYEVKSEADRTLIYITLYITECLKKLQRCTSKNQGLKEMHTLAVSRFDIPGDAGFPLNAMYTRPSGRQEEDNMRAYFTQIRQECGIRVCEKVFDPATDKPSKWWMCFVKRKFMDMSLSGPGQ